jgi:DNA-binding IscR family transcriptional regulator
VEINVWETLQVLGGPLFSDEFCSSHPGNLRDCVHSTDCSVRALWRWVGSAVGVVLKGISLADMARPEQRMGTWLDDEPATNGRGPGLATGPGLVQIGAPHLAGDNQEVTR